MNKDVSGGDAGNQDAEVDTGSGDAVANVDTGKDSAPPSGSPPASDGTAPPQSEPADGGLSLSDELRNKLVGALPKEAQDRAAKYLKTRSSMADLLKAGLGADSKISELTAALKGMVKVPGKDAKPEDIAAYRKAVGVPESAEKYAVYRPDGYEPTEADVEAEKTFLEGAIGADMSQRQVDGVLKTYYTIKAQAEKARAEAVAAAQESAIEDLRVEFGRDYKANVSLADRYLADVLGPDMGEEWKGLMGQRFENGIALGEMPGFVKAIVKLAKAHFDDGVPELGGDGIVDTETEIQKMMAKMGTPEYETVEFQRRLDGLIAASNKRKGKAA